MYDYVLKYILSPGNNEYFSTQDSKIFIWILSNYILYF